MKQLRALWLLGCICCAAAGQPVGVVSPSGPTVPENLLRIEIAFSSPLRAPLDMAHVALLDATGQPIRDAFLDLPLPSSDGRRVSLLLHPARVKSGVGANVALGRALAVGSTVSLRVDDPMLARPVERTWQVVAFDRDPPAPERWLLDLPPAGSRAALEVRLDAPITASAQGLVAVRAPDGTRLAGRHELTRGETRWRFFPAKPWRPGRYALVVHPDLEDLAGNRPCVPFERVVGSATACGQEAVQVFSLQPARKS